MKTLFRIQPVVLLTFLLFGSAMGGAESLFQLSNMPSDGVDAPIFDASGNPLGPDYLVELWGSATPDSLLPAYAGEPGNRAIIPFLGLGYFGDSTTRIVPSSAPGGFSWLEVRAWDSRLGPTYEEVAALDIGGYGESTLFYAQGTSPYDQFPLPAPLIGLESFNLRPVPEPSTWALLAAGGFILWLGAKRRRRR